MSENYYLAKQTDKFNVSSLSHDSQKAVSSLTAHCRRVAAAVATLVMVGLVPLAMQAQTPAATIPYTCDFENNTENGRWALNNPNAYVNHWIIGTSTYSSSNKSLYVSNSSANEYTNTSSSYVYAYRQINFATAGEYTITFKWKARGESGCWDAMYAALCPPGTACPPATNITSSTNSLPTNYINVADVSQSNNTTGVFLWTNNASDWKTSTKSVNITTTGNYYLVFYWKNDGSGGTNPPAAVDDISITRIACPAPTLLTNTAVTPNSATVSWTENGTASSWILEYSTSNTFPAGSTTTVNVSTNPYTITGLTSETTYYVRVKANCGGGDESGWSNTCEVLPSLCKRVGSGTTTNSYLPSYSFYNYTLSQQIYTSAEVGSAGDLTAIHLYNGGSTKTRTYDVYIVHTAKTSFTSATDWITVTAADRVFSGSVEMTAGVWTEISLNTPFPYNGTSNLAIIIDDNTGSYSSGLAGNVFTSDANQAMYVYSDGTNYDPYSPTSYSGTRLSVKNQIKFCIQPPSSCPAPSNLTVSNITTTSARINWTAGGSETRWDIYYSTSNTAPTESTTPSVTNTNTKPYTINGISPSTTYYVWVRANCGGGDVSYWCPAATFTTECDVITSFPWSENFDTYAAGDFTAPCWINEHIGGGGTQIFRVNTSTIGTDGTHQLYLPDMSDGTTTRLVLPPMDFSGACYKFTISVYRNDNYSSYTNEGVRVFASTDGNIAGATELAFIPRVYSASNDNIPAESSVGWYSYDIDIPLTGVGYIVIRGESRYGAPTYMDNFAVSSTSCCKKPKNLTVSNVTTSSATIDWTAGGSETRWDIYYSTSSTAPTSSTVPSVANTNTKPYTLTGLTPGTTYYVWVRANCGGGEVSDWLGSVNFTTIETCPAPNGVSVSSITYNSAIVSWHENGSATAWDVFYNTTGVAPTASTVPNYSAVTSNPYTITGLTAATTYYVWVRANCGGGDVSAWVSGGSFMTDLCDPGNVCEISFELTDSYGDGWNGAAILVYDDASGSLLARWTIEDGSSNSGTLAVCNGRELRFEWEYGSYDNECSYVVSDVNGRIFNGSEEMDDPVNYRPNCPHCPQPLDVTVSDITDTSAQVSWTGDASAGSYNIRWWQPVDYATVTLTAGDVWDIDDTGYQLLLDADANTYGTVIPTTGGLTTGGDADAATYAEFEYKIPTNADWTLTTSNVVFNNSITIQVPAGTYDWCITNPTPDDRMWIASTNGNVGGRADDYVFEAGKNYEFVVSYNDATGEDRVDLTVSAAVPGSYNHAEGITGSPYTITGLEALSTYIVQVQADCDGDGVSDWSIEEVFVTPPPAPTVTQTDAQLPECDNGNATLVASASIIPDGYMFHWYSNSTCTTEITTGLSGTNNNTLSYPASSSAQVWCRLEKRVTMLTYNYTGSVQSYAIPDGTSAITMEVWGAEGGGQRISGNTNSGYGGKGGYSIGTLLSPTGTLYICVGGTGSSSTNDYAAGGYNGGGSGHASSDSEPGNGGGGATHIATASGVLSGLSGNQDAVLIVAGGGGGGGEDASDTGGDGGGTSGGNGNATGNEGGTQLAAGPNGGFGQGASTNLGDGGGGGGGWYGGGSNQSDSSGGDTNGGGGGSGYLKSTLTNASTTAGQREGDGMAKITVVHPNGTTTESMSVAGVVTIQCCALDAGITFPEN